MSKATTGEELKTILDMRRAGVTLAEIGAKVGKGRGTVLKIIRRHGVGPDGAARTPESVAKVVLRHIERDVKKLTPQQKVTAYKALTPRNRRGRVAEEPHDFQEIDLGLIETTLCTSCGLPGGCKAAPICPLCLPDEVFTSGEEVKIGKYITTRQVKCLTEGCPNVTTNPLPRYEEPLGRDGLCNSCRKASPEAMAALQGWLESIGWVSLGGRWVKGGSGHA
jgi:hypothetical protein